MKELIMSTAHIVFFLLSLSPGCLEDRRPPVDKARVPPPALDTLVPEPLDIPPLEPAPLPWQEDAIEYSIFRAPPEPAPPPPPSPGKVDMARN